MQIKDAELMFNRSLRFAFSRKKLLSVFPVLVLCGLLIVLCRALAVQASSWVVLSLTFLPVFLSFGVLLAMGAFLIKIYRDELLGQPVSFLSTLKNSWQFLIGVSYLALPMILAYLLLWTVLGIFYLLRQVPGVGEPFSVIFSFGPFLLVLGCLILSVCNFFLLFFITPHVALKGAFKIELVERAYKLMKENFFSHFILFLFATLPLLFIVGLLSLAAALTGATFSHSTEALSIALAWFFIMIPFVAILSPAVIFFFNFAAESAFLIEKNLRDAT